MVLATYATPFGLRQVKLVPLDQSYAEIPSAAVFLPASRTFSFKETEEFEELQGDDTTVASHGAGPTVEWDLEGGGISLDAWKVLSGGTIVTTGTSPNVKRTFTKKTTDSRPYFNAYGRAIADNGGDLTMVVYRCKADGDLEGELSNGSFLLTAASGKGYGNLSDQKLYDFVHSETAVALTDGTTKTTWTLTITGSPTGGAYRLIVNGYSTPDIAYNAINTAIASAINGLQGVTGLGTTNVTGTAPTFTITLPTAGIVQMGTITLTPGGTNATIS
jgi:hypothetical protein